MDEKQENSNLPRRAAAAAHIAHGAATGGPYGAAAAAAWQLGPTLLKIVGALFILFILLPVLLLTAVPCYLFGTPSVSSSDIQEMTARASQLTESWRTQRTLEQRAVDLFISLLPDTVGFIEIEKNLGNTNDYWMVAITSVESSQDVRMINEDSIVRNLQAKLKYELKPKYNNKGELIGYILVISDMTPDELMGKLAFTDQQRMWAGVVYETIAGDEYGEPTGSTGDAANTDYENITFVGRGNSKEVVYYNQGDTRWGNLPYGRSGTIRSSGCGPTSLAICVATLTDKKILPPEIVTWAYQNGYRAEGNGSYHSLIPDGAMHYGVPCKGIGQSKTKLIQALQEGKLVIAIMSRGHFTSGGHFIVLRGITDNGKILVADCASYRRSEQEWDVSIFLAECFKSAGSGGPFWVLG